MTPVHAIIIVIIRLWAAASILGGISSVSYILGGIFQRISGPDIQIQPDTYYVVHLVTPIVWFIAGFIAWFAAPWLSRRIYPTVESNNVRIDIKAETLIAIGGFLIGGFYLAKHGPQLLVDLAWWFAHLAKEETPDANQLAGSGRRFVMNWQNTISNLLIVVVAVWMMFRPSYLARIFNWLRNAGQYETKKPDPAHSREGGNP
ncbi:MAG: hypothetical protein AAGD92_08785 [Pseudomonadota bacterium]